MMAGQPVRLAGLPAAQGAAQQDALVLVGEAGQRPYFLPPALPDDRGQAGHQRGDDQGDHGGNDQGRQGGDGLQEVQVAPTASHRQLELFDLLRSLVPDHSLVLCWTST